MGAMSRFTEPQLSSAALVTIDVQRDVMDGQPLEIPGSSAALGWIARLAAAFRERDMTIVHVVRLYRPDGSNVDLCRREAVMRGWPALAPASPGAQLPTVLLGERYAPLDDELLLAGEMQSLGANEVIMYKPRWGAFFQTPLHVHLSRTGVNTLVFAGFNFPNCPRASIYQASERDFRVVAVSDAISGVYQRGRTELSNIGVAWMTTHELITSLAAQLPQASASASAPSAR
jgi:nicotinamidase-related amidase